MPLSRWSSRHKKTFGEKKKEKWDGNFRLPPKPDSYYVETKGCCRWCGTTILNEDDTINMRKTWHEDCATEYLLIYHSGEQRAQLWSRDKGICNHCGKFSMGWQADHIKPLVEQKGVKEKDLDWSYYKLENLQTLCKKCHRTKTNSEVVLKGKGKRKVNYRKWSK